MEELINSNYKNWLGEIKSRIRSSQIKAAIAVNSALNPILMGFRENDHGETNPNAVGRRPVDAVEP